jgi:drug/metabolite transporter (DMT)-like permease
LSNIKEGITGRIFFALLAVYIIWGSTYLAIRIALEGFPPFLMAGIRFLCAGCILFLFLRARGEQLPTRPQVSGAALVGAFLLLGGNGGVVFAEQTVASGIAALAVATVPLWTVLFSGIWKRWPGHLEWAGLILGFAGIVLLNFEGDLKASPACSVALIIAAVSWAFGSALSNHLPLPRGLMASAVEMMAGGLFLIVAGVITGEKIYALPSVRAVTAFLYLIVFGSLIGFSAYVYLLGRVRPVLATSYAYVNPIIAVILGIWLAGERITGTGVSAMLVILTGVVLGMVGQRNNRRTERG